VVVGAFVITSAVAIFWNAVSQVYDLSLAERIQRGRITRDLVAGTSLIVRSG